MPKPSKLTAKERSLRARIAAHEMHAQHDAKATTAKAIASGPQSLAYWERHVDPSRELDVRERRRRAEHARSAHFARLQLASSRARREAAASKPNRGKRSA